LFDGFGFGPVDFGVAFGDAVFVFRQTTGDEGGAFVFAEDFEGGGAEGFAVFVEVFPVDGAFEEVGRCELLRPSMAATRMVWWTALFSLNEATILSAVKMMGTILSVPAARKRRPSRSGSFSS
jgi:hypothetical protein